jgi:hypothetical protein
MEEIEKCLRLVAMDNLQALLALHEMERIRWIDVIGCPETTPAEKAAAILRRDEAFAAWGSTVVKLEELRRMIID